MPSNTTPQPMYVACQAYEGLPGFSNNPFQVLMNYMEPTTTTGSVGDSATITVPINTTDYQVVFSTEFPSASAGLFMFVQDISNPGMALNIGLSAGGPRIHMAASGFIAARITGSQPTLYIDNSSVSSTAIIRVGVLAV